MQNLIARNAGAAKITLLGSYKYGKPHAESDMELWMIVPCGNAIDQSIRISVAVEHRISLNLIGRTPEQIQRGLTDEH
jgi:hypothetical protein